MSAIDIEENRITNKKDRDVFVIERDKYIRVDVEYLDFNGSTEPFDKPKKIKGIVYKALSKARKYYPIMKKEKRYNKVNYNKYTGELYIKIEIDYWKVVPRTTCINTNDYLLMWILGWIESFITRKLSECRVSKVYYKYIINIDRT